MSVNIRILNSMRKCRKIQRLQSAAAARASKKAKLYDILIPESTVALDPQLMCKCCNSNDVIDANQLRTTQWKRM